MLQHLSMSHKMLVISGMHSSVAITTLHEETFKNKEKITEEQING